METNSDSNQPLTTPALRHGLAQILKCYAAGGLRRFNRVNQVVVSPNLTANLNSPLTDNALTTSRLATDIPAISSPATDRLATQKIGPVAAPMAAPAAEPVAELSAEPKVARVSLPLTVSTWQLPNLPESERLEKLNHLNTQVQACRKCEELVCYRRQTVFGEGKLQPRVCFFGEAPGADEDQQGRPFVGAAGKLLMDIIKAMRLSREEVYILNSLKCRPPQNRTPLPEEVDNCRPYAITQLEILQPEFIILLGAVAVQSVLQSTESVGRLRGRFHHFHGARVLVTYHPAYLLRNADAKKLVWADVQMVMRELEANPPN